MESSEVKAYSESTEIGSNILIDVLGPRPDNQTLRTKLTHLPALPSKLASIPIHIRIHHLQTLRELYVPTKQMQRLAECTDQFIRQRYSHINPVKPQTWTKNFGDYGSLTAMEVTSKPISVFGEPGTGKTEGVNRCLSVYGEQVRLHKHFPMIASEVPQLIWLQANVPDSGRAEDLAVNLMQAFDRVLNSSRFVGRINSEQRDATAMLGECRDVAQSHFLGILHLDDAQNLFKEQAHKRNGEAVANNENCKNPKTKTALEAVRRISEEWQIPIIFTGTPDVETNLNDESNDVAWFKSCNHMTMHPINAKDDQFFRDTFFPILCRYQWVKKPMPCTPEFASLVLMLSGGVYQIIITLWIAAHRVAFDEGRDELKSGDFTRAAATYLAPLKIATEALRLNDPRKLAHFDDLLARNHELWISLERVR